MINTDKHQVVEDNIKNISFYNAYKIQETSDREHEIEQQQELLKQWGNEDKIKDVNDELAKQYWETPYKEMTKDEQLEKYKELYNKQEHYYIYDTQNKPNNINHSMNELKNLKELNYLEKYILSDQDKYQMQYEVNKDFLDNSNVEDLEKYHIATSQNATNQSENYSERNNSDLNVFKHNNKYINDNKDKIKDINISKETILENKTKEAKVIEKLKANDLMKRIVEEQGKNSMYLTKEDDNTLDARANVNNTYSQIANNNTSQYGSSQKTRDISYTNAYTSLQYSNRINTANYSQNRENEMQDQRKEEQQETQENTHKNKNKQIRR